MAFESSGRNCPNCGASLTDLEISSIESGSVVRCSSCSHMVTKEGSYPAGATTAPTSSGTYTPAWERGPQRSSGGGGGGMGQCIFFIGIVLLALGLLSWIIYIPIFSSFFFGEIGGALLMYIGWQKMKND
ncbi:MAG: hypothetical protein ACXAEF_12505 [Candidatus Thorarchaeota archaeon]